MSIEATECHDNLENILKVGKSFDRNETSNKNLLLYCNKKY